jgi:hypothetical protein
MQMRSAWMRVMLRFGMLAASVAAVAALLVAPVSVSAQAAPRAGSYRPGPQATGNNTYIGRIEAPRRTGLRLGADLLVAGWFVDTTASGWAGADKGEVWLGQMGQGTRLGDLTTGQPRADIRDALGVSDWTNSGFSGTVPASTLSQVPGGDQTLNVYLHTPSKGWWFKSAVVAIPSTTGLQFPNDPIVNIAAPQQGQVIDQFAQKNNKFTLKGLALDRNPVTDPNTQTAGANHTGISLVQVYLDGPRGEGEFLGNASVGGGLGVNNDTGVPSSKGTDARPKPGPPGAGPNGTGSFAPNTSGFSLAGLGFGEQFALAGWSLAINPPSMTEGQHSVWVYARSSITGKENSTSVTFTIQRIRCNSNGAPC